jgi:carbon-monoxide dehydrogenase medium subunit
VKPPPFEYHAPRSLTEALALLAGKDNARVLAGGQSLMPMLNMRLVAPDHVIDLNCIEGLAGIREDGDEIVFGAMTRQREIEFSALVAERLPLLAEAVRQVGHRQTRNRGTLGGSLCHLDPAAELPTVAVAMDAALTLRSPRGLRQLAMRDFGKSLMTTALAPDELLTEIRLRPWPRGHGWCFTEFARRSGDFAVVSVAALVSKEGRMTATLGGIAPVPVRIEAESVDAAVSLARSTEALEDPAYPAWYRRRLAATLTRRALEQAAARVKR